VKYSISTPVDSDVSVASVGLVGWTVGARPPVARVDDVVVAAIHQPSIEHRTVQDKPRVLSGAIRWPAAAMLSKVVGRFARICRSIDKRNDHHVAGMHLSGRIDAKSD
jgi:hypothetical protein